MPLVSVPAASVARVSVADLASCRHGTCARYNSGCRCEPCRAANTARKRGQRARWAAEGAYGAGPSWAAPAVQDTEPAGRPASTPRPRRADWKPAARPALASLPLAPTASRRRRTPPARLVERPGDGTWLAELVGGLLAARVRAVPAPPSPALARRMPAPAAAPPPPAPAAARGGLWGPEFGVLLGCGCTRAGEVGVTVGHVSWCQSHRAVATVVDVFPSR